MICQQTIIHHNQQRKISTFWGAQPLTQQKSPRLPLVQKRWTPWAPFVVRLGSADHQIVFRIPDFPSKRGGSVISWLLLTAPAPSLHLHHHHCLLCSPIHVVIITYPPMHTLITCPLPMSAIMSPHFQISHALCSHSPSSVVHPLLCLPVCMTIYVVSLDLVRLLAVVLPCSSTMRAMCNSMTVYF